MIPTLSLNDLLEQNLQQNPQTLGFDTPQTLGAEEDGDDAYAPVAQTAPAATSAAAGTPRQRQFIEQYAGLAQATSQKLGVAPEILLGQWALETGWGKSVIPGTRNLGNIKDFSGRGPKAKDNMTGSVDSYRAYATDEDFANDYARLIGGNKRYAGAAGAGDDARHFFTTLKRGGYAEDPLYIPKATSITNTIRNITGGTLGTSAPGQSPSGEAAVSDEELLQALGMRQGVTSNTIPNKLERSGGQLAQDIALSVGQGALGGVKAITDIFGADNAVSKTLDDASKYLGEGKSAYSKQVSEEAQQRIQEAEAQGWQKELGAYWDAFWDNPAEMIAQGAGSFIPFFGTSLLGAGAKSLQIARAAKAAGMSKTAFLASPAGKAASQTLASAASQSVMRTNIGMGAAMGLGGVKGSQYEQAEKAALAAGKTPEEAKQIATAAQEYSLQNLPHQALGTALGVASVAVGPIAKALSRVPGAGPAANGYTGNILTRAAKGTAAESTIEAIQDAQQRIAGNTAAIDQGVLDESQRYAGAVGQGLQAAMSVAPLGAGGGIMHKAPNQTTADTQQPNPDPNTNYDDLETPAYIRREQERQRQEQEAKAQQDATIDVTYEDADGNPVTEVVPPDNQTDNPRDDLLAEQERAWQQPPSQEPVLQNRDRKSASSIEQMQRIAAAPNFLKVGPSTTMDSGAPIVFGGTFPESMVFGNQQAVTDAFDNTITTQYAVVEASDILTSNHADGSTNPDYAQGQAGKLRAVAGNGRAAGLAESYARGNAHEYRQALTQEAQALGIDPQAIDTMQAPMLVRVMDEADITTDIGDRSNIQSGLQMSPVEQAGNDLRRLQSAGLDFTALEFDETGTPTTASVNAFIEAMPQTERGNMRMNDGTHTRQVQERIGAAAFKQAYQNDALVELATMATDEETKRIITAMRRVAPDMAALTESGDLDTRKAVSDAAVMAINAKRRGIPLRDMVAMPDLDADPEAFVVAQFFADNITSGKRIEDGLRNWAGLIAEQVQIERDNQTQAGMFGATPTLTRAQLFERLNPHGNTNTTAAFTQNPAGPEPATQSPEPAAFEPAGQADPAANSQEHRAEGDEGEQRQAVEQPRAHEDTLPRTAFERAQEPFAEGKNPDNNQKRTGRAVQGVSGFSDQSEQSNTTSPSAAGQGQQPTQTEVGNKPGITEPITDRNTILPGDIFETTTGRHTTPYPNYNPQAKKAQLTKDNKAALQWLKDNAIAEAQARSDDFNLLQFQHLNIDNWSPADSSVVNSYLFGDEAGRIGPRRVGEAPRISTAELSALDAKQVRDHARTLGLPVMEGKRPLKKSELIAAIEQQQKSAETQAQQSPEAIETEARQKQSPKFSRKQSEVAPETANINGLNLKFSRAAKASTDANLIITHNLSAENLLHAQRMGGLATPSLAVTTTDTPLHGFGEITLIGGADMAKPGGDTKVFGADIYSPRYPSVERDIDSKALQRWNDELEGVRQRYGITYDLYGDNLRGDREGIDNAERNVAVAANFLEQSGIKPKIFYREGMKKERVAALRRAGFAKYLKTTNEFALEEDAGFRAAAIQYQRSVYEDLANDKESGPFAKRYQGILNDFNNDEHLQAREVRDLAREIANAARQAAKPEVDRRNTEVALKQQIQRAKLEGQYKKHVADKLSSVTKSERIFQGYTNNGRRYVPHTLENVVKILKKDLRGGENFNYGVGSLRAKYTPQFKSVEAIRAAKDKLISQEQFDALRQEIDSEFNRIGALIDNTADTETITAILEDSAKMNPVRAAQQYDIDIDADTAAEVSEYLGKLRSMPTSYFEAKITRAVGLDEFTAAVVPRNLPPEILQILKDAGIQHITTYKADDKEARAAAVKKQANKLGSQVKFSFAGQQAQTADQHALSEAQARLDAGADPEQVRQDTGWHQGNDGKWRFEISDADAKYIGKDAMEQAAENDPYKMAEMRLEEVLDHPALFAAYPGLRDISVAYEASSAADGDLYYGANYNAEDNLITIGNGLDEATQLSALLHEIQHGIQNVEGFATGGGLETAKADVLEGLRTQLYFWANVYSLRREMDAKGITAQEAAAAEAEFTGEAPNADAVQIASDPELQTAVAEQNMQRLEQEMARIRKKGARGVYEAMAGEVEARNTQARQRMTDAERRATPPSATQDVADFEVIVTFNGKEMHSATLPANAAQVQEQSTPRTPVTAIRAAIAKAYGKLLDKLESKGLVTLTQTQEQAIDAAAQARAAVTGESVESVKQSLMASVKQSWEGGLGQYQRIAAAMIGYADAEGALQFGRSDATDIETIAKDVGRGRVKATPEYYEEGDHFFRLIIDGKPTASMSLRPSSRTVEVNTAAGKADGGGKLAMAVAYEWAFNNGYKVVPNGSLTKINTYRWTESMLSAALRHGTTEHMGALEGVQNLHGWSRASDVERLALLLKRSYENTIDYTPSLAGSSFDQASGRFLDSRGNVLGDDKIREALGQDDVARARGIGVATFKKALVIESGLQNQTDTTALANALVSHQLLANVPGLIYSQNGAIEGFHDPVSGKTFLIADALTEETAPGTLMHEVGIHMAADSSSGMQKLIERAGLLRNKWQGNPFVEQAQNRMEQAGETSNEEFLAYVVTQYENGKGKMPMTFKLLARDFIAAVRAWLHNKGWLDTDSLTVADLAAIARANAKRLANNPATRHDGGGKLQHSPAEDAITAATQDTVNRWQQALKNAASKPQAKEPSMSTPAVLRAMGAKADKLVLPRTYLKAVIQKHPDVPADVFENLPAMLADPLFIIPHKNGGVRVFVQAQTAKGEPIFAGISVDGEGRINTVSPLHDWNGKTGAEILGQALAGAMALPGRIYAKNKEALGKAIASARASAAAAPAILALHRDSISSASVLTRDAFVKAIQSGKYKGDVRYSRAAQPKPIQQPGAQTAWQSPSASKFDDLVYQFQDKHIDTKRLQESLKAVGKSISDDLDVYLQETLFHGRAAKRTQDFVHDEITPLVNYMKGANFTIADVEEFLHARHAPEANAIIAQRDPAMPDGGSGMTNAEAAKYMQSLHPVRKKQLEKAASMVDKIIAGTRQTFVDYGLESQSTVNGWTANMQHYVPLQREDKDGRMGIGQGFSVKGKEVKGRTGSTRKVVDILSNVIMQRERAIVRGEKNRVATALLGLAQQNQLPGFWQVDVVPTTRTLDKTTGQVTIQHDPLYKQRDNAVIAKVGGQEHAILFAEDNDRAMRMAAALKNLDAAQLEGFIGNVASFTRYFAAVNTQYNPIFGMTNLARDLQEAMLNLQSTPLAGKQLDVLKGTFAAIWQVGKEERARRNGGHASGPWSQLWQEFQDVGGQTGYRDQYRNAADRADTIQLALTPEAWHKTNLGRFISAGGILKAPLELIRKNGGAWLADLLSDYNTAMENGVRLSAYKTALESGMSQERAAALAKGLTVNFNRKGAKTQQIGALYAFFNASVQGTARMGQTLFDMEPGKPKTLRLSKTGKAIVTGGIMLGAMQAVMLALAGFGDDEPPEFIRERNLLIPTGGKSYISIPMPLGYHVIANIGRIPTEWVLGGFKDTAKHIFSFMGVAADIYNPLGGKGLSLQTIAPTVLDPMAALAENKDFSGRAIAKESFNKNTPGHALGKDAASGISTFIAQAINYATGGSEFTRGELSPTPDQIDYLIGQVTGGVGREATKLVQTGQALLQGDKPGDGLAWHKIPLVSRFYGSSAGNLGTQSAYYNHVNRVQKHAEEVRGLQNAGRQAEAQAYLHKHPEAKLAARARLADRQVKQLRQRKRDLEQAGASRDAIRQTEYLMAQRMAAFNQLLADLQ